MSTTLVIAGIALIVGAVIVFYDLWCRFGGRFVGDAFLDSYGQCILLTFDDGPASGIAGWSHSARDMLDQRDAIIEIDPNWDFEMSTTANLLRTLAEFDAKAIFFLRGDVLDADRSAGETARQICRADHLLGNHSYAHARLQSISSAESVAEMAKTHALIDQQTGVVPRLFRPPYGYWHIGRTLRAWRRAELREYCLPVGWTHSTEDWAKQVEDLSREAVNARVEQLLKEVKSSESAAVLLQHDVWIYAVLFTRCLLERIREEPAVSLMQPRDFLDHAITLTEFTRSTLLLGYYLRARISLLHKRLIAK